MKKALSLFFAAVMVLSFMTACKNNDNDNVSSNTAKEEPVYSSEVTTESETSSKEESKKPTSSTPSKVETPSETSSNESKKDTSSTVSLNIIQNVGVDKCLEIGVYHFEPHWTTNSGTSESARFEEFESVISQGYFNSVICSGTYFGHPTFWAIVKKYNLKVWLSCYAYYDSEKLDKNGNPVTTSIDTWVQNTAEKHYAKIKGDREKLKNFQGFFFDETIWRGQSNRDFLTMTEALYRKYGRRIHVCESMFIFRNWKSSADDGDMDLELTAEMRNQQSATSKPFGNPAAFKYVTDLGLDYYYYDVRQGTPNSSNLEANKKVNPEIVDGAAFYKVMYNFAKSAIGDGVNIWYWPCAYTTSIYTDLNNSKDKDGVLRANEQYCLAQLNFFREQLLEQKYQGGIYLYNYINSSSNKKEKGLSSHLQAYDGFGNQLLYPETAKWSMYCTRLRTICQEFSKTKANQVEY